MLHWVAFVLIGLVISVVARRSGWTNNLGFTILGSVIGGWLLSYLPPDVARYGSLVSATAGGMIVAMGNRMLQAIKSPSSSTRHQSMKKFLRRMVQTPPSPYSKWWLVLYGLVIASASMWGLAHLIPNSAPIMASRISQIQLAITALNAGAPPLLGITHSGGVTQYFPIGVTDDQGIYLYVPLIAHLLHVARATVVLKWFFITLYVLPVILYPTVFHALFKSTPVALFSPLPLLLQFSFLYTTDVYWVPGWILLFGLPLICLVYVRWTRWSPVWLGLIMIVASFASSIRIESGLPLLLAAILVVILRMRPWMTQAGLAAVLVVCYLLIQPIGFHFLRVYRDSVIKNPTLGALYPTQHPIWHNIYIGLGYIPNPYGITWSDTVAADAVYRVDPHAGYLSPTYGTILRQLVLHIVISNPAFIVRELAVKMFALIEAVFNNFPTVFVLLPGMLLVGAERRLMRTFSLLLAPGLLVGAIPPLLTVPFPSYETGWLAASGLLWMFGCGWLYMQGLTVLRGLVD